MTNNILFSMFLVSGMIFGCSSSYAADDQQSASGESQASGPALMANGRFVPEREDDFAWENDKVAFRVYGPNSSGTGAVSGVDAWFKKVDYPVIDKWYAEHLQGKSYHTDHGEGYDVYHVGSSRGVGGTAVWVDGVPYPAGTFSDYEVLQSGGDVVEFTLNYEWETPLGSVGERKTISLELGSQLYQVKSTFTLDGEPASLPIAIGLTTHDGAAGVSSSKENGRISTWEEIDGHGVGTGVLIDPGRTKEILHLQGEPKDTGHVWLITSSDDAGKLAFEAGFAWQGAGEITSSDTWNHYLDARAINVIGDRVADWQLSKLGELDYFRTEHPGQRDPRAWHHGAFYVGLMNWADLPGNEKYYDALKAISAANEWKLGRRLFHADDHVVGQLYLHIYEKEQDREMIRHTIEQFNQILTANPDNSLEYAGKHIPGVGRACQLRWCWCDALFMSPPTWIKLSLLTGDDRYMAWGDKEFWATHDYLLDPEHSLFYRDSRFFTQRDAQGNKTFWSRGNGWVYAGLVNILRMLPPDHPSYGRYLDLYKAMSATIVDTQRDNGLWSVSLLSAEAYPVPETSGSAFMVYGLAWGLNSGHLDTDRHAPAVRKGWSALVNAVDDDGKLGWVQPVGSAPDSVLSSDSHLYGVGAFLLAASQMIHVR